MSLPKPVEVISALTVTASGASAAFNTTGSVLDIEVEVTAISGTAPSVAFAVQWSDDGTNWGAPSSADTLGSFSATGNAVGQFAVLGEFWQLVWTVGGTSPSATFNVWQSA